ncbi:MAG: M20 family metallopeptidase [Firmicutes bacterium]|nr:M20 family metallopeptidase [Bacillota bacterium]
MKENLKRSMLETVEMHLPELKKIRDYLYENPEVGGTEEKASALLEETLKNHGFLVDSTFHGIPYCFRAVFDSGKPGPSIGLTAEYDALPEIGHGCGHDIIAAAPLGAALALKEALMETGGRVVLFGTPAEECFVSKVQLSQEGAFDEVDVAMTIHPNPVNLSSGKTTALDAWQVEFYGKSAHAGAHPEEGINALDAAVHFYSLIGFEKQYLKDTNIYGVFVDGGEKCSVIPDHASVKYIVRADSVMNIRKIRSLFERCAAAAAGAVGATWKIWNNEPGNMDMVTNDTLSDVFNRHYEALGGGTMPKGKSGGSTDMGDVSHVVPAIHPWIGMGCPQLNLHSREFAEATITPAGDRVLELGAKALALTGLEVLTEPELLENIKKEFEQAKKAWQE